MAKLLLIILVAFSSCARYEYDIVDGKKVKYYHTNKRYSTQTGKETKRVTKTGCMGICKGQKRKWFKFF